MSISVGNAAPEFSLPDQDRQVVSLTDLRGTPVLLVFYPFAFSRICTGELCQLRDELTAYTAAGVRVLALSTDPAPALKAWRGQGGFDFPLLSGLLDRKSTRLNFRHANITYSAFSFEKKYSYRTFTSRVP